MPADLKVVPLGTVPLTDIPGHLRRLANDIEAGEYGEVKCLFALMPNEGDNPTLWGWGDVERGNDPIIQLELAKMWLLRNIVSRA